jgi:ribosome-binding factor A
MLERSDVERIIENVLRNLSIQVVSAEVRDPNIQTIILKLEDKEISRTYIDVSS